METATRPQTAPDQTTTQDGKRFVQAIIAYLKEKGRDCVTFVPSTYEDWNDIPFCNRFQEMIDTVSISDDLPDRIIICVCNDAGVIYYDSFDGTEDEDFDYLFHEVYYYINDAEDPEAEEWAEAHGIAI